MFSIAVFGPIVNEGYVNADSGPELRCIFNGNAGACRFGVALGLGAFLACAGFLLLDVRFQQISSIRDRRRAVLLDLGFSGGRGWGGPGRGRGPAAALPGGRDWAGTGARFSMSGRGQARGAGLLPVRARRLRGAPPDLPVRRPAGLWSFLWFVGFCFLTNQWQRTEPGPGTAQAGDAARAAITFSFFSILSWVSAAGWRLGWGSGRVRAGSALANPGLPLRWRLP